MSRNLLLATAFIACIALGAVIKHVWTESHAAVDLTGFVSIDRHDEIAGDVIDLKDSIDPAAIAAEVRGEIAANTDHLANLAADIEGFSVTLADMQNELHRLGDGAEPNVIGFTDQFLALDARIDAMGRGDGLGERLADRVLKLEKSLQAVAGRANHAHCKAHQALGEPCR